MTKPYSSVRSWQPILMIIMMTTVMTTSSERRAMRGREPRNAVEDLAHRGRSPERFRGAPEPALPARVHRAGAVLLRRLARGTHRRGTDRSSPFLPRYQPRGQRAFLAPVRARRLIEPAHLRDTRASTPFGSTGASPGTSKTRRDHEPLQAGTRS